MIYEFAEKMKERLRVKSIYVQKYFQVILILAILVLMCGCGSGSGGGTTPNEVVSKGASVSIIPSSDGEYALQGNNMDGVAGIALTINYDSSTLSSPTVTQGGLISGALMQTNTTVVGAVRIAIVNTKAFSGSGQIATVSFASVTGTGSVSIGSVKLIDSNGATIP